MSDPGSGSAAADPTNSVSADPATRSAAPPFALRERSCALVREAVTWVRAPLRGMTFRKLAAAKPMQIRAESVGYHCGSVMARSAKKASNLTHQAARAAPMQPLQCLAYE